MKFKEFYEKLTKYMSELDCRDFRFTVAFEPTDDEIAACTEENVYEVLDEINNKSVITVITSESDDTSKLDELDIPTTYEEIDEKCCQIIVDDYYDAELEEQMVEIHIGFTEASIDIVSENSIIEDVIVTLLMMGLNEMAVIPLDTSSCKFKDIIRESVLRCSIDMLEYILNININELIEDYLQHNLSAILRSSISVSENNILTNDFLNLLIADIHEITWVKNKNERIAIIMRYMDKHNLYDKGDLLL